MPERNVEELADYLRLQKKKYYEGAADISDAEFDELEEYLRQLDPTHPYFSEVGAPVEEGKIRHEQPMRSLTKSKTIEKVTKWLNKRFKNGIDVLVQPKIDGVSISTKYENGYALYSATRGDGVIGKDVSHLIEGVEDIPQTVPVMEEFEIRGETYLPRDTEYAAEREHKSLRNIAAGIVNRKKDSGDDKYLKFVAYDVVGLPFNTEEEKLQFLNEVTPNTVVYEKVGTVEGIQSIYEEYEESKREALNYDIDGLVIKINDVELQQSLETGNPHHPNFAIAYKFPPQSGESVLRDVEWTTGETGKITPIGHFDPVIIGGRTITKATLHNQNRLEYLQLEIGDVIEVSILGDVIPGITANLSKGIKL